MRNNKNHILITKPYLKLGGVYSFVENITPFFETEHSLFFRGENPKNSSKLSSLFSMLFLPFRFIFNLLSTNPKYVIVNSSFNLECLIRDGLIIFLAKLFRKKVLLIVHGFSKESLKYKVLIKIGYFKSDAITVLSNEFKNHFIGNGYKKPIHTLYNPIPIDIINYSKKSLEIKSNHKEFHSFLFLSRVEITKGIYTTIDAFKKLQETKNNVILYIAGIGTELKKAKAYVKDNNIQEIYFLGFIKDSKKIEALCNCDVLIFPTHTEGLPINVLEAMAMGQVIITRPVGGLVNLFDLCSYGFNIKSLNSSDFEKAMREIIDNKDYYKNTQQQNAMFALENFHPQKVALKVESIINSI